MLLAGKRSRAFSFDTVDSAGALLWRGVEQFVYDHTGREQRPSMYQGSLKQLTEGTIRSSEKAKRGESKSGTSRSDTGIGGGPQISLNLGVAPPQLAIFSDDVRRSKRSATRGWLFLR
jgi:hypothetical protein